MWAALPYRIQPVRRSEVVQDRDVALMLARHMGQHDKLCPVCWA